MAKAAVIGNLAVGATTTNVVPCGLRINLVEAVLEGAVVASHPDSHPAGSMTATRFVRVNGAKLVVNGDPASCGHAIIATGFLDIRP